MWWKLATGALIVVGGAFGYRYYMRHRHTDACPTAEQVRQIVLDLEANRITIMAAQLRADAWEHDGCQIAADAVRAMIKVRQNKEAILKGAAAIGEAIVNWIPGCTPPSGWTPAIGMSPGAPMPAGAIPGWTAPDGWLVGTPLPAGTICPSGWTSSGAKAVDSSVGPAFVGAGRRVHPRMRAR